MLVEFPRMLERGTTENTTKGGDMRRLVRIRSL